MSYDDRSERLNSAAELISILKSCGCSQRFIAAYLGISHAKLSRWNRTEEDSDRKSGVPSKEQLVKLAALLRFQLSENLKATAEGYETLKQQPVGEHVWHVISSYAAETQTLAETIGNMRNKTEERMRRLERAVGQGSADGKLVRELVMNLADETRSGSDILRDAHARAAATAASELEASKVKKEDAEKAHQELESWREKYREKVLTRARNKRRRQAGKKSDPE